MIRAASGRIIWRAVATGWAAAILTGVVFNLVFRVAHRFLFDGAPLQFADTPALITISLISGFLAHSVGGYAAGRSSRSWGGLNGAMVAVLGTAAVIAAFVIVAAIALATAGALFAGGISLPPALAGLGGGLLLVLLALFVLNLLGGYVGGKLGELEIGLLRRSNEPPSQEAGTGNEQER